MLRQVLLFCLLIAATEVRSTVGIFRTFEFVKCMFYCFKLDIVDQ